MMKPENRYDIRHEDDGTWTVFDTTPIQSKEPRIMYGLTENRARQYLERLNRKQGMPQADVEQDTGLNHAGPE